MLSHYVPVFCLLQSPNLASVPRSLLPRILRREPGTGPASFPGRSHLQYLIACRMQIRRGKVWEIWSCAVTSCRRRSTHRGAVSDLIIIPVSCQTVSGIVNDEQYWCCLRTLCPPALGLIVQERFLRFFVGHRPPCLYPLSTWCNCTWPDLSGLPPPYLPNESNQILEVRTTWEWG